MNDLFGIPIFEPAPKKKGTKANGYAARPGSGPVGETCRSCINYRSVHGHQRPYLKCALCQKNWTNGPGTDIKAKSPACFFWEAQRLPFGVSAAPLKRKKAKPQPEESAVNSALTHSVRINP